MRETPLDDKEYMKFVEKYFSDTFRRSYKYGKRWDEGLWRIHELSTLSLILQSVHIQEPVLDIGCGNGDVFNLVFGSELESFGVDISLSALGTEHEQFKYSLGVAVEDARKLSFADESFGLVFSNSVLEHIDDVDQTLFEAYRVLVPKGVFIFTTPAPAFRSKDFYYWRKMLAPVGLDGIGKRMGMREDKIYHHVSVRSFDKWKESLFAAGFKNVYKYEYIPPSCSLVITKYSGASRVRNMIKYIGLFGFDKLFSRKVSYFSETEWINYYYSLLKPYLRPCLAEETGGGQIIIAYKQ